MALDHIALFDDDQGRMTSYPDLQLYIDGTWRTTAEDMPVVNPATEQIIGRLPVAGTKDLDDALDAAAKGSITWRQTAPRDRADVMMRAAAIMRARQDEIAHSMPV